MNATALLQKAIALDNHGNLAGAIAGYQKVLGREPSNVDALFLLGRAYCQQGELESGAKAFRRVITLRPSHAPAHALLGMAHNRLGRPQDALACFDRALEADPKHVMAIANKADALAKLGRHADAVVEFDKAVAIDPSNIATWSNRGNALQELGRETEAVESFKRALAVRPDLAEVHFNLANALHKLGRNDESVHHYRRAIALRPGLVDAYINLVSALIVLKDWEEIIRCCEQLIKLRPNSVFVYYGLGFALLERERYEESLANFDKALAIDPNHARTLHQKARLLYYLGQIEDARALCEKAIEIEPRGIDYFLQLVSLKRFVSSDRQLAAMEDLLQGVESLAARDQTNLHFSLAKAYNDFDDYERSFQHLAKGNALARQQFDYDECETIAGLERIREVFSPGLMRSKSGHGNPSVQPIFIVGMPRSGSTLIEQILAGHPHIHAAGEIEDFWKALRALGKINATDYPEVVPAMTPQELGELGAAYVASATASMPAMNRFTDKQLYNFAYAGLIHLALPNAHIIHTRRNPIDTCLSCFSLIFNELHKFAYDLGELGRYYRAYERVMDHWRDMLPEGVMLDVQYEDVVEDMEIQARRIIAHCGLEWDEACLAFHKVERPVRSASAAQVREPIYRNSVGRWRRYRDHLQPLLEALDQSA
jgi:tetratricopeptide (TPR) repeat protein